MAASGVRLIMEIPDIRNKPVFSRKELLRK